jgi:ATP-binding protein involved in chromosome partitioning
MHGMTPTPSESDVWAALAGFQDPETGRDAKQQGQLRDAVATPDRVGVTLALSTHSAPLKDDVRREVEQLLRSKFPGVPNVEVKLAEFDRPPQPIGEIGLMAKSVIAVGSGKGGVGKSTIAASLAYGLHRSGAKVGLLDADVYGPSVPQLLGLPAGEQPEIVMKGERRCIVPKRLEGMPVMSMGFLVKPGDAIVWRGPMLHGAIHQMLRDTDWGALDYLIIDMPPGTGDIALSLSQILPLTGAVIVCTPQDVALLDAVKAIAMFRKVNIPILGMVENMSYFLCPDNGKRYDIFGTGGAKKKAAELDVPFLGEVPINIQVRINGDEGAIGGNYANVEAAPFFEAITRAVTKRLSNIARVAKPLPSLNVLR